MEDAGFIIASYVVTFGGIAVYAWSRAAPGPSRHAQLPDEAKPWT